MASSALQHPMKPLVIFALLSTKSEEKANTEFEHVRGVVEHELRQPECGSYVFMQPREGDKTALTVFEGYDNIEYASNGHRNSDAFKAFRKVVTGSDTRNGVEIQSYTPKGGFLWREEIPNVPLQDQLIWIAKLQSAPGKRAELIEAALIHANNVHRTEDGALSFVVLERNDDDVSVVLFERYTSKEYFDTVHRPSASMKEYQGKIAPILAARQSEGYTAKRGFIDKREEIA